MVKLRFLLALINNTVVSNAIKTRGMPGILTDLFCASFGPVSFVGCLPITTLCVLTVILNCVKLQCVRLSVSSPVYGSSKTLTFLLYIVFGVFPASSVAPMAIVNVMVVATNVVTLKFIRRGRSRRVGGTEHRGTGQGCAGDVLTFLLPVSCLVVSTLNATNSRLVT